MATIMSRMTFLEDIRIAQSLDDALHLDGHCLEALSVVNQAENDDHRAALALARGDPLPPPSVSQRSMGDPSVTASLFVPFPVR
jgi:hypothetical protein